METEKIISSLLNIREQLEQSQKRLDVILQKFEDVKNNLENFQNNFNEEFTYQQHQLCVLQEEEEHAIMAVEKGEVNPDGISQFSDLHLRLSLPSLPLKNYFIFSSFMSVAPSTNDSPTVNEKHLAIRLEFDPGGIDFQFFDSPPSPQNNSHTIFQPVDPSHSRFSVSLEFPLSIQAYGSTKPFHGVIPPLRDGYTQNQNARVRVLAATNRPSELDEAIPRRLPQAFERGINDRRERAENLGDEIVINLLYKHLEASESKEKNGFILDGFPRSITQAAILYRGDVLKKIKGSTRYAEKAATNIVHMELGVDVDNDDFNELVEAWSVKVVQPLKVGVLDNTEVLRSENETVRGGVEFAENGKGKKFSAPFMLDEVPLRDIAIHMVIPIDEKSRLGWRVSRYLCKHVCNDFPVIRHIEDLQALHSDRPHVFGYEPHLVLLNGVFGSVIGASASVENAGLLASMRDGSRRIIQISVVFRISFSVFGKLGAFFASIPVPFIAALYFVFFSYIASVGANVSVLNSYEKTPVDEAASSGKMNTIDAINEAVAQVETTALYGPAAAKIPPPQINLAATSVPQFNSKGAASAPRMGAVAPTSSQNLGFRAQGVPNPSMNQHYFPSQQNQSMRPPQVMPLPSVTASHPSRGTASPDLARGGNMLGPNAPNSNISNDWLSGRAGSVPNGPRGIGPSMHFQASQPQSPVSMTSQPTANASKALVVSGNGFASGPNSVSSTPAPSAITPVSAVPQPLGKQSSLDSLQSAFPMQPVAVPRHLGSTMTVSAPGSSSIISSGISVGLENPTSDNTHLHWPKMKPSDVQKYTKVFLDVDIDRDGKITGEEARNLFLSWRLPREVLKQVWDLSDQDNDSMLSLREFCFALYMMERYREGRPLPAALPPNVMFDETLLSMTGQSKVPYGNAAWGPSPGFGQLQGMQGARPIAPATGLRPPMQVSAPQADGVLQSNQQKSGVPALEDSFVNQLDTRGPNSMNSKPPEATTAGKKVEETQNMILDSKEKLEFYHTKMQELVLYKSRCDNKLNEITERASADKREAESLGSKYEEKYKQVAEIASKLTIEEARFCDIQERKVELHQAIVNMEHGGSADGILQVRADRIQSDLEELLKALTERCKKHGLDIKSTVLIELPIGWEPGIQEGAALWDEEWDKFEDEGFVNDLTLDAKNTSVSPRPKSAASVHIEKLYGGDSSPHDLYANGKPGNSLSPEPAFESESAYSHSEDELARSPQDSLAGRTQLESPSQEFSDVHYGKGSEADAETHRSFDESTTWGAFDNNDDVDSVWGFNTTTTKYSDNEKHKDLFGSSDFDVKPVRTGSSHAESIFPTKIPIMFEDSVPGTPMSNFGNSPRYSEAGDHFFDNSTRFDSFSMHDGGFSPQERFTRFDSMSSRKDLSYGGDRLTRFDSMSSTKDFSHSGAFTFDDTDPFGSSGPFRVSSENQTPKRSSDNWSAF